MSAPVNVWELRESLQALRSDPPDTGFEQALHLRLADEKPLGVSPLRRPRLRFAVLGIAAAMAAGAAFAFEWRAATRHEAAVVAPEPAPAPARAREPARPAQRPASAVQPAAEPNVERTPVESAPAPSRTRRVPAVERTPAPEPAPALEPALPAADSPAPAVERLRPNLEPRRTDTPGLDATRAPGGSDAARPERIRPGREDAAVLGPDRDRDHRQLDDTRRGKRPGQTREVPRRERPAPGQRPRAVRR